MSTANVPWSEIPDGSGCFFAVQGEKGGDYPNSNSLLVLTDINEKTGILLDAGVGNSVARKLRKAFTVTDIYFTHWHEDHVISHRLLATATKHCHGNDIAPLENVSTFMEYYGVKGTAIESQFATFMEAVGFTTIEGVKTFNENDKVSLGNGDSLDIILAPGHTRGHCIFHDPRRKVAFLGDIDLGRFGPWYAGRDSSLEDFINSIDLVSKLDIDHVVTGHASAITGKRAIQDAIKEYKQKIFQRDERVLDLLARNPGSTVNELIGRGVVYKHMGEFKEYFIIAERIMITQHLVKLVKEGRIIKNDARYNLA